MLGPQSAHEAWNSGSLESIARVGFGAGDTQLHEGRSEKKRGDLGGDTATVTFV